MAKGFHTPTDKRRRRGRFQETFAERPRPDGDRQRLADVARLSSEWLWETDAELGITTASHRVFDVLGFLPCELEGQALCAVFPFDHMDRVAASLAARRPFRGEACTATARDGQARELLVSAVPVFAPDSGDFEGFRGTARDVTAERRAAQATARGDAILKAVGEAAQALLAASDLSADAVPLLATLGAAASADRVQVFSVARPKGGARGACTARRTSHWIDPAVSFAEAGTDGRDIPLRAFGRGNWEWRLARGAIVVEPPERRRRVDMPPARPVSALLAAPVFVAGTWWGMMLFDRWTTRAPWTTAEIEAIRIASGLLGAALHRDRCERRLEDSRALLETTFATSPDSIAVIRIRDGLVMEANERFRAIAAADPAQVIGRAFAHRSILVDHRIARRLAGRLLVRGGLETVDIPIRDPAGAIRIAAISARVVTVAGDTCALVVARDVTQERRRRG